MKMASWGLQFESSWKKDVYLVVISALTFMEAKEEKTAGKKEAIRGTGLLAIFPFLTGTARVALFSRRHLLLG